VVSSVVVVVAVAAERAGQRARAQQRDGEERGTGSHRAGRSDLSPVGKAK
jgi:hypothetical protein